MLNIDSRLRKKVRQTCKQPGCCMWLLETLAERMNENGECWPSIKTLAKETGYSEKKVQRLSEMLKEQSLLSWKNRIGTSNKYKLPKGISKFFHKTVSQNEPTPKTTPPPKIGAPQNKGGGSVKIKGGGRSKHTHKVLVNEVLINEVLINKDSVDLKKQIALPSSQENTLTDLQPKNQDAEKKEKSCAKKEKEDLESKALVIKPKSEKAKYHDEVVRILTYLTNKTGQEFKMPKTKSAIERYGKYKLISKLLKKGFDVFAFKKVVDVKFGEWWGDKKMCIYIRPETLFNENKFEGYLNQFNLEQKQKQNGQPEQSSNNKSKAELRRTGGISEEFDQATQAVFDAYGGTDGFEYLERVGAIHNSNNGNRSH